MGKIIKLSLVVFALFACVLTCSAQNNILNKITVNENSGVQITLNTLENAKYDVLEAKSGKVSFEIKNIELSNGIQTVYNSKNVENIIVSQISNDKIRIDVVGKNVAGAKLNFNVQGTQSVSKNPLKNVDFAYPLCFSIILLSLIALSKINFTREVYDNSKILDEFNYIPSFNKAKSADNLGLLAKYNTEEYKSRKAA